MRVLLLPRLVFLAVAFAGSLPAAIPSAGLAGHWRFAPDAKDRAADLSPGDHPLVLAHATFQREAGGATSLVCDGFEVGGQVEERTPLAYQNTLTAAIWLYPLRSRGQEPLLGRPNANPAWSTPITGVYLNEGRPIFGLFGPKKLLLEGPALPLRTWTLLVVTADGRTATLWLNGRKVAEAPQPTAIPAAAGQPWYIGRSATQYFRGRLGESFIWNRALTAAEIGELHASTSAGYASGGGAVAAGRPADAGDRFVDVESPGTRPEGGTWRARPTRALAGLNGFTTAAPPPTDRWGGRTDQPARKATGFFRTEQIDGRWWLITPEGHLYWNVGINSVRAPRATVKNSSEEFAVRATQELRTLGFNGLGNHAASALQAVPNALPWSIRLNFISSFAQHHKQTYPTSGHTGFTEQCFPAFHPDFPAWAARHAEQLKATLSDASAIGIFTDNELQCPVDLLDRHLKLPANDPYLGPGRAAALAWLAAEKRPANPAQLTLKDRYRFIAHIFATYTRIVHSAIRAVDKNHLILGPRFNVHRGQFDNPWFWPAVAPYVDVVAVNYYALWGPQAPDIQEWSEAMRRPVMLTEWYSKALDAPKLANTKGAGWLVRTQKDRALYYQHFVLNACETPALVGFHYFKYMDDDSDSVALDSAGGANKGICRADGTPWPELQTAAREVNTQTYRLIDFFDARRKNASK